MEMAAWVVGILGIVLNLILYQQTTSKKVLLFKLLSDVAWAVQYLLLGAYTGFGIACIAVLREGVFYKVDRKSSKGVAFLAIFTVLSVVCAAVTWSSAYSLLPAIGSVISVFGFYLAIPRLSRLLALPISLCMGLYSLEVGSVLGVANEVITVTSAVVGIVCIDLLGKKENCTPLRVSAVNWDCSLPSDTYFGYYQTRSLSPRKYRTCTPYYATVVEDDKIEYTRRSQREYDRELRYAIRAGIDYFSYVFYPEQGSRDHVPNGPSDCSHKVYELNVARRLHQSSKLRRRIGMAAIMGAHPFAEADYLELARLLQQPYYEKIDGRPLVYLFHQINEEKIRGLLRAVKQVGGQPPVFIAMFSRVPEGAPLELVDGLSAYCCARDTVTRHDELVAAAIADNEARAAKHQKTVPLFPMGWDPSPRIDHHAPWIDYPEKPYAAAATPEELVQGGRRFAAAIAENEAVRKTFIGHLMLFAWNEFEEGAWICPTYNEDLSVNTQRVKAVAKMVKHWKKTLKKV